MPPPLRTKKAEGIHRRHSAAMLCMATLLTALLSPSVGHAQTIYRCGSDYSPNAACEQASTLQASATAQPVASASHAAPSTQQTLQKQADALEKQRLQNERAVIQPTGPVKPRVTTLPTPQATDAQPMPRPHKKHTKVQQSPYFTAYGAAPAKPSKKAASAP